jgi:hypothetical protein
MATLLAHPIYHIFDLVDPYYRTVKNGGSIGDTAHVAGGGYHISREDLIKHGQSGDYSIQYKDDKVGPSNLAAALDLTYTDLAELELMTHRVMNACAAGDPRVAGLRENIGTIDGKNVCGFNRVSSGNGSRSKIGVHPTGYSDRSHLWHGHLSILRKYVNDVNLMIGLAEVIAGVPAGKFGWVANGTSAPEVWDGKSFPGADKFYIGANGPYITLLGMRLVVHGWTGYSDGPGPDFSATDQAGVKWFQEKQGWTGTDADGIPGQLTWALLLSNPTPVVVPPIVVTPVPPVIPTTPPVVVVTNGIPEFVGVSFNGEWQGFASTKAKADSWSVRLPVLVNAVASTGAVVCQTQEMGEKEAADFYAALEKKTGKPWAYQRFGPLNTVAWRTDIFDYDKTVNIDTPDYGQYPGRGYCEAWLLDKNGNRLRLGSGHNPVKTAADSKYQEATVQMIVDGVNDEIDDWPLIWGDDTNNKQGHNDGMWAVLKKNGYDWIYSGIDAVFSNFGAVVTMKKTVDLKNGSDHNMLVYTAKTTKK